MKNIMLIGDSIMFGSAQTSGYGVIVKEMLKESANIYIPPENARFALYTLRYLENWIDSMPRDKMDIIHWNNLEWDIAEFYGDGPLTPLPFFIDTLRRIHKRLKLFFPNAHIIFATGTKVIEERSLANINFERHNSIIEEYNKEAKKLMQELEVDIDDLYEVSSHFSNEHYSDWVHPNYKGAKLLADSVVNSLEKYF